MPEMPEVETMVERLQKFVGYSIVTADGRGGARYLPGNEKVFASGQKIEGVFRRGKFIIFALERGAILAHNAMSGYWDTEDERWTFDYVEGKRESKDSDIRCGFLLCREGVTLAGNGVNLFFHDARKFGFLKYLEPDQLAERLSKLGPEMLMTENAYEPTTFFKDANQFWWRINKNKPIKEILMNQDYIAGIGNIYAAEALWKAHIAPTRMGSSLSEQEQVNLFESCRDVLSNALARGLDYEGLKIYRRKLCPDCNGPVSKEKIKGRSTYWCQKCQR